MLLRLGLCLPTFCLCACVHHFSEFFQRTSKGHLLLCQPAKVLTLSQGRHCQQEEEDHGELVEVPFRFALGFLNDWWLPWFAGGRDGQDELCGDKL